MNKTLTPFEEQVKQALDNYELPYDNGGWKEIEKGLALSGMAANGSARWVAILAAAVVTAVSSFLVYDHYFDIPSARMAAGANRITQFESNKLFPKSADKQSGNASAGSITSAATEHGSNRTATQNQDLAISNDRNYNQTGREVNGTNPNERTSEVDANGSVLDDNRQVKQGGNTDSEGVGITAFKTNVRTACSGYDIDFQLSNGPSEGSYLWNFGDGTFSSQPNPKHKYSKAGVYDVSLSVTTKDGLIRSTTMEDLITINPTPEADFEWDFIGGPTDEPTVKFINLSENASTSEWTFDGNERDEEISPVKSYIEKGKHTVQLFVSNEFGCSDEMVRNITINSDYNLLAPPTFSPNDDKIEDTFMPEALRVNNFNFEMTIYDGNKPIYKTSNKNKPWDGKLKDGSKAQTGVAYPWVVTIYNDITKEEKYFSGSVTIVP